MYVASWWYACFVLFFVCLFLYRLFCHGALKLDMPTLLTTFFSLNINSIYICSGLAYKLCLPLKESTSLLNISGLAHSLIRPFKESTAFFNSSCLGHLLFSPFKESTTLLNSSCLAHLLFSPFKESTTHSCVYRCVLRG